MISEFDVVVVGAGPGGIAAATISAEAGKRVCLVDDNASPGGQIWRGFRTETAQKHPHFVRFLEWTSRLQRTDCEIWLGWHAVDCPATKILRFEREGEFRDIRFRRLILATGARERFLPFPGWTLPGVTGAGGLQALVKTGLNVQGRRVVVAGSGPLLLAIAAGIAEAGARIVGIYEQALLSRLIGVTLIAQPDKIVEAIGYRQKLRSVPYRTSSWIVRAEGRDHIDRVTLTDGRKQWTHQCDWLACGFHLVPNLELPLLLGCRIEGCYVSVDLFQQSSVPGIACIGELTGIGGLEKAMIEGQIAGWAAAGRESECRALASRAKAQRGFARRLDGAFAPRPELRKLLEADTLVCRCEDVPYGALKQCNSAREARLHTRCGMGACQGRICGAATEFLFGWGQSGVRPPVFPTAVSTLSSTVKSTKSVEA